ncbi:MAG: Rrf2 family transcriptional regulator [Thermoanaerobaculia bacterium]
MLSLSQTTGYAIQALGCLARCGEEWHLAKDIADCSDVPLPYLQKILHTLRVVGLVEAKRGYRGGFKLVKPAEEISLLEVAQCLDPEIREPRCLLGFRACSDESACSMHHFWEPERRRLLAELGRMTVAEVVDSGATMIGHGESGLARENQPRIAEGRTERAHT